MKDMNMTPAKQTFPAVSIEALPNGLLRLEDETSMDGIMVVVFKDLEDLTAPDLAPTPDALANPGGQMTIDL